MKKPKTYPINLGSKSPAQICRRDFLKYAINSSLGLPILGLLGTSSTLFANLFSSDKTEKQLSNYLDELLDAAPIARYWTSSAVPNTDCSICHTSEDFDPDSDFEHENPIVKCNLCAQECQINIGERGKCRVRINIDGKLCSLVYGRPISIHIDPIEKKPFYHFLPGANTFSLATVGCPLHCQFCQNWELSQAAPEDYQVDYIAPQRIVNSSLQQDAPIIAFTYNEPTVFTEYLIDIARLADNQNLRTVLISCGFMKQEPLTEMCSVLDAIKIDLKGFSESFYHNVCDAELKPVLRSIKQVAKSKTHLEIVNLVVPSLNDSRQMLTALAEWIVGEIGPDVPVHFTRFHPDYKMRNLPPTPISTLEMAYDIAREKGMNYPFVGNVPGHPGNNTICPTCGEIMIKRKGFFVTENQIQNGICRFCDQPIAGVWN